MVLRERHGEGTKLVHFPSRKPKSHFLMGRWCFHHPRDGFHAMGRSPAALAPQLRRLFPSMSHLSSWYLDPAPVRPRTFFWIILFAIFYYLDDVVQQILPWLLVVSSVDERPKIILNGNDSWSWSGGHGPVPRIKLEELNSYSLFSNLVWGLMWNCRARKTFDHCCLDGSVLTALPTGLFVMFLFGLEA